MEESSSDTSRYNRSLVLANAMILEKPLMAILQRRFVVVSPIPTI
jgi:hypothetical protein